MSTIPPSRTTDTGTGGAPETAEQALRVESLTVTYKNHVHALRPTSLNFTQGDFVVLLGSSGAGKSTLLRALNGLVRPSSGRVVSAELGDIANPSALHRHRRRTGMIFQQHHLIGRLSVLTNVLTGRLGYHHALATLLPWSRREQELALAAIDRVGLLDQSLKRADHLSGGQQQRVGVARALVQQPRLLLADEPVASLDPATAERLLALMHEICRKDGLTAVISLHQVDLARRFADRIIGLAAGNVTFDGPPAHLTAGAVTRLYGDQSKPPSTARIVAPVSNPALEGVPA